MAKKKFYRPILYYLLITVKTLFSFLPYRLGFWFGGTLGKLSFRLLSKERKKTLTHLNYAFGDSKSHAELQKIGLAMFENYGRMAAELALYKKLVANIDEFVTIEGREHLDQALSRGDGVIGIVSHFGNWEYLGGTLALKGYKGSVIARRIYYEKYDKMLVSIRNRFGEKTIYRDRSAKEILKTLRQNHILGFVVDQDVENIDGVFVNFFGKPAFTPSAPVRLSLASGAPLLPLFILRQGMKHRIFIEPAMELTETGDKEKDIITNTQKWVTIQEKWIRQYPEQWVWNHKRWKTQPI